MRFSSGFRATLVALFALAGASVSSRHQGQTDPTQAPARRNCAQARLATNQSTHAEAQQRL